MTNKLPPDVRLIINRADNIGLSCHANRQESVFSQFPYPIPCYPGNRGPHFRLTRVFSYLCRPRPISWGGGCMSISTEKDIPHVFKGSGLRTLKPEKIAVKFLSWWFFCFSVFIPRLPRLSSVDWCWYVPFSRDWLQASDVFAVRLSVGIVVVRFLPKTRICSMADRKQYVRVKPIDVSRGLRVNSPVQNQATSLIMLT